MPIKQKSLWGRSIPKQVDYEKLINEKGALEGERKGLRDEMVEWYRRQTYGETNYANREPPQGRRINAIDKRLKAIDTQLRRLKQVNPDYDYFETDPVERPPAKQPEAEQLPLWFRKVL